MAYSVDLGLLKSLTDLPEALLGNPLRIKKSLISLYTHVLENQWKLGTSDVFSQFDKLGRADAKELKKAVYGPLGNPAWALFHADPGKTEKLVDDLNSHAMSVKEKGGRPQSLKSLMKPFLEAHPEYGSADDEARAMGLPVDEVRRRRVADAILFPALQMGNGFYCTHLMGDVLTSLMMVQAASLPQSRRERIAEAKAKNPEAKPSDMPADDYYIHRPEALAYLEALKGLGGVAAVEKEVWDEMASMHSQKGMTSFLPFLPLFLQWFSRNHSISMHTPGVNQMASLFGEYSGGTSHFMGELATRMASGFKVEWKTLGLGLGKLCRRKDELPDVTADDRKAAQMLADRQTRIVLENDGSVSTGTDLGWHVMDTALIGEPNVLLAEIRDSLRSGKISYAKIAKTGETLVFRTSSSRKRLKEWAKGQGRKQVVEDVLGTQVIAARTRLPPVHVVEVNPFTVLPRLTRDLRLEKKDRSRDDSLYFTSGTHQEELSKRQEIREQRKQVQTKLQYDAHLKSENFAAIDDQLLMEAIDRMSLDVADTDKMQMLTEQQARHAEGVLDEYFEELVKRRLGITFDGLAGTDDVERMNRESLCFRFRLGDEELLAADKWAAAAMDGWDEDSKMSPTHAPASVKRTWAAMSLIRAAMYIREQDDEFSMANAWDYHIVQRFPFSEAEARGVMSILPQLYWVYGLGQKDHFRKSSSVVSLPLHIPTTKLAAIEHWQDSEEVLPGTRLSSQSLTSKDEWKPSDLLERACDHLGIIYPDGEVETVIGQEPEETKLLVSVLKKGMAKLKRRLSNQNLIQWVAYCTMGEKSEDEVKEIYDKCWEMIDTWFHENVKPNNVWREVADGLWLEELPWEGWDEKDK